MELSHSQPEYPCCYSSRRISGHDVVAERSHLVTDTKWAAKPIGELKESGGNPFSMPKL